MKREDYYTDQAPSERGGGPRRSAGAGGTGTAIRRRKGNGPGLHSEHLHRRGGHPGRHARPAAPVVYPGLSRCGVRDAGCGLEHGGALRAGTTPTCCSCCSPVSSSWCAGTSPGGWPINSSPGSGELRHRPDPHGTGVLAPGGGDTQSAPPAASSTCATIPSAALSAGELSDPPHPGEAGGHLEPGRPGGPARALSGLLRAKCPQAMKGI